MGKTLFELAKQAQPDYPHQIILAKVDGKLHELKDMEIENEKVEYITTAAAVGNETYRRSVVLLMLHARVPCKGKDKDAGNCCGRYSDYKAHDSDERSSKAV